MEERSTPGLRKELGLFDVYSISTGAMFSSGFFLLPGLAAAATGPSVPLAYMAAGILIVPAMLSVAELATAMPRAGGAYYFLDRSMGPLVGTVGGLGTWLALILKTAFALVGMGAYLSLYVDVAVEPLALGLTALFMVVNVGGAKETSGLQRALVSILLVVMVIFMTAGFVALATGSAAAPFGERFQPFFTSGAAGFIGTIGLVFVSYAGLTKVASVAEEVRDPDRNIPLGMTLSLATAMVVYTVGVGIVVALLPAADLRADLTPIATAAAALNVPALTPGVAVLLIVAAAVAAFASTGNAGILAASRYPLAMGRDGLVSERFSKLGRFRTPTLSIIVTAGLVAACIALFDVSSIAKLASAFQLLLFSLLSLGVVIMRESGIAAYDPGYRSPLYPWMQIFGVLAPIWLIAEMGQLAILFTLGLISLTIAWYFTYARTRALRSGAILHTFARLGAMRHEGLDLELRGIVKEKGLRAEDPFDEVVARAEVLEADDFVAFDEVAVRAADRLSKRCGIDASKLEAGFLADFADGFMPIARGVALPHYRVSGIEAPELVLARCHAGLAIGGQGVQENSTAYAEKLGTVRAVFFLLSGRDDPTQHLRILGHLAALVDDPDFLDRWMRAENSSELRRALLQEDRLLALRIGTAVGTEGWIDLRLSQLELPEGCLIALVRRGSDTLVPSGSTHIREGDHLTLIGEPTALASLGTIEGRRVVPRLPLDRALPGLGGGE